jgi:hypothetical protein
MRIKMIKIDRRLKSDIIVVRLFRGFVTMTMQIQASQRLQENQ